MSVTTRSVSLVVILLSSIFLMALDHEQPDAVSEPLPAMIEILHAGANGKAVFGEYLGGQNCPPCESGGSPSMKALKNKESDSFVYISYIAPTYGNLQVAQAGNVAPINRVGHLTGGSNGAPKAYFGDCVHESQTCYQSGAGGTTTYDPFFYQTGGKKHNMGAYGDHSIIVFNTPNGTSYVDITVQAAYIGTGTAPSSVSILSAMTEKSCNSHPYTVGGQTKAGNCWKAWLLNAPTSYASSSGLVGSGTAPITLDLSNGPASYTWTVPLNLINGGFNNLHSVVVMFDSWSSGTTRATALTAGDSDMAPPIDLGFTSLTSSNSVGTDGSAFIPGDELQFAYTVQNNGIDPYSDGGDVVLYRIDGMYRYEADRASVPTLAVGATTQGSFTFDTTDLDGRYSAHTFETRLENLVDDGNAGNDLARVMVSTDQIPTVNEPAFNTKTELDRGDKLVMEITGDPVDNVESFETHTAILEASLSGGNDWSTDWVYVDPVVRTKTTGVQYFYAEIEPDVLAMEGDYDIRLALEDSRGQRNNWLVEVGAFSLLNGPPTIAEGWFETVAVSTDVWVDMSEAIIDPESPVTDLTVTSTSQYFLGWNQATGEMGVHFDGPITKYPSGQETVNVVVSDGEPGRESNILFLDFRLTESGRPVWRPFTETPTLNEGGATYPYPITDFVYDSNTPTEELVLTIENSKPEILNAMIDGMMLSLTPVSETSGGIVELIITASDGESSASTNLFVHVNEVNDLPTFDTDCMEALIADIYVGWNAVLDIGPCVTDVDHDHDDLEYQIKDYDVARQEAKLLEIDVDTGVIDLKYETRRVRDIEVEVIDPSNGRASYTLSIDVVPKTLTIGDSVGSGADFDLTASDMYWGFLPTLHLQQSSDLIGDELEWQMCSAYVCYDNGIILINQAYADEGWNFILETTSEDTVLEEGDVLKIIIRATDSEGRPWTSEMFTIESSAPPDGMVTESDSVDDLAETEKHLNDMLELLNRIEAGLAPEERMSEVEQAFAESCTEGVDLTACQTWAQRNPSTTTATSTPSGSVSLSAGVSVAIAVFVGIVVFAVIAVLLLSGKEEEESFMIDVPAQDLEANSMFGGSEEIFQSQVPQVAVPPGAPPLPPEGLPPGWTMEQWSYYGKTWLEQNGRV